MTRTSRTIAALAGVSCLAAPLVFAPHAQARPAGSSAGSSAACPPAATALGYSDALDKQVHDGVQIGGLSSLARDARSHSWVTMVDNHLTDPSRIWFVRDLAHPRIVRDPLVLRQPDGTPYTGQTADNEGLAVLPNGDFLVSSEAEPSVRIFGRNGVQKAQLPMPARLAVTGTTPAGEATGNATLEGLTLSRDGHTIVASMEGALSGDVTGTGAAADATAHRLVVWSDRGHHGWHLVRQIGYRTQPGNRIPEVQFYGRDNLLVEEASWSKETGNQVQLYAVTHERRAADVSRVQNLGAAPASDVVHKTLVADVVKCPSLGATSKETQANPLMDNFEGMAITGHRHGRWGVTLVSDDNFSATQTTRVLNLSVRLPR